MEKECRRKSAKGYADTDTERFEISGEGQDVGMKRGNKAKRYKPMIPTFKKRVNDEPNQRNEPLTTP
jgi:hypothetical protein